MRKGLTLTVDAWGNIIVAGPIHPDRDGFSDETFVAKLDKDGNVLWQRGLVASRSSSLPPPAPGAAAPALDARDSVEPQLLDEVDQYESELAGVARFKRAWRMAGAAALAACAVAGTALAVQHAQIQAPAALMQHNVQREARITGELAEARVIDEIRMGPAAATATTTTAPPAPVPLPNATTLREETLKLLTAGLPAEALPHARALVAADPHHAMSYLFLGAALQDMGRANEAREVYNDCVKLATTGDASECYALGGRR
jgi:hypothetical protein